MAATDFLNVDKETRSISVRFPLDLVDFVEDTGRGANFTEKLLSILADYRDGTSVEMQRLKELRANNEQLEDVAEVLRDALRLTTRMQHVIYNVQQFNLKHGAFSDIIEEVPFT